MNSNASVVERYFMYSSSSELPLRADVRLRFFFLARIESSRMRGFAPQMRVKILL